MTLHESVSPGALRKPALASYKVFSNHLRKKCYSSSLWQITAAAFSPRVQSIKFLNARTANKVSVTVGEIFRYHQRPLTPTRSKGVASPHPQHAPSGQPARCLLMLSISIGRTGVGTGNPFLSFSSEDGFLCDV